MISHYLKISLRYLKKQKIFTLINILSLTIGLCCFLLALLYLTDEYSYDTFHKNYPNIYRILRTDKSNNTYGANTPYVLAEYLKSNFSEAQNVSRILVGTSLLPVTVGQKSFSEKNYLYTDQDFFRIFSFKIIQGNPNQLLSEPNSVVLSESQAKKYFPGESAIGKIISIRAMDNDYELKVSGIIQDIPRKSHLHADLLISTHVLEETWNKNVMRFFGGEINFVTSWRAQTIYTYILARPDINVDELNVRLAQYKTDYLPEAANDYFPQALREIYLNKLKVDQNRIQYADTQKIWLFALIGFFILIISCFNYIILSTGQSTQRIKEIGVRKVIGAHRKDLVFQILYDSLLYTIISLVASLIIIEIVLPYFNSFISRQITLPTLNNPGYYFAMFGIVALVALLSGSYLAFYLLKYNPQNILKYQSTIKTKKSFTRQFLIIIQIIIFITQLFCTFVIRNQVQFLKNKNLGYNPENLLLLDVFDDIKMEKYPAYKDELSKIPGVISISSGLPFFTQKVKIPGNSDDIEYSISAIVADYDYLNTMQIKLIEGRDFSRQYSADQTSSIILNQTAVSQLGLIDPIGKQIIIEDGLPLTIIGIMNDYHENSLYEKIQPRILRLNPDHATINIYIRLTEDNQNSTFAKVNELSERFFNNIKPAFVTEQTSQYYTSEQNLIELLSIGTLLSICIAVMGLFGTTLLTTQSCTKEIGIRKVFGATTSNIITIFSKQTLVWIIIGLAVGLPSGYLIMINWLRHFAYQIHIQWWIFAVTALFTLLITGMTVSVLILKTSRINPVKSLRYE